MEFPASRNNRSGILSGDPLALIGIAIVIIGVILIVYGFMPRQQILYKQVASGQVPLDDPSGNFIQNPESYFAQNYTGVGSLDKVVCSPDQGGYACFGFEFAGTRAVYSVDSRYYGLGMVALGLLSYYGSKKLSPLKPRPRLTRRITVRVDEDICVANGVCVKLAPTVFQLRKPDEHSIFAPLAYVVDPTGADNDTILTAAEMCPTGAIVIEDAETGERIHPPIKS
ncbi:MAG: ferredoxin [Nitrososphaerota archaeon]|nr:ferredoxin [Nitrososphaerota archaeon]